MLTPTIGQSLAGGFFPPHFGVKSPFTLVKVIGLSEDLPSN